jgi:hypothetical protein
MSTPAKPACVVDPRGLTHVLGEPCGADNGAVRETLCRDYVFCDGDENYTPQPEPARHALVCTWCRTFAGYDVRKILDTLQRSLNV